MFTINQDIIHLTSEIIPTDVVSITPDICLDTAATIRWEIVRTGELPISEDAFPALSGVFNFNAGDIATQTLSLTPNEINHGFARDFEIRFYQVVGARDDKSAEEDDILLSRFSFDIAGKDDIAYRDVARVSGSDKNVITLGTTSDVSASGAANNDRLIISKYQYGDVTIDDGSGVNLIQFDVGVAITGFKEVSGFGGAVISAAVLTLSTGAKITVNAPLSSSNTFQFGDGDVFESYEEFRDKFLFASDDDTFATNTAISFTNPITVKTHVPAPVLSDPRTEDVVISTIGLGGDDILLVGTDYDVRLDGAAGDDILLVTRFQYGDVDIQDSSGFNLIKFDVGVEVTGFEETSILNGKRISEATLMLSTGAEISIRSSADISITFQFGNGDVMNYTEFRDDFLFASDDDTFATNTEITFTTPFVVPFEIAPVFTQQTYSAKVSDDIESGSKIVKVQAWDEDTPLYDLTYYITHGNDEGLFAIDSTTGLITLAIGKSLDFSALTDNKYTISVEVRGGGGGDEPKARAIIEIMENEAPEFTGVFDAGNNSVISDDHLSANIELTENFAAFDTPILTLSAKDDNTEALLFTIISGNLDNNGDEIFSINTDTGAISVRNGKGKYLDEDTSHMITIRVCDSDGLHDDIDINIISGVAPVLADVI